MPETDLFSALSRYDGSNSPENYLTEAFAFLLRHLLAKEPAAAVAILNCLCGADDAFRFKQEESPEITIETQVTTDHGRPDMAIRAPGRLAYVEVKQDSPLTIEQIRAYLRALEQSGVAYQRLVVLTRYAVEVPSDPRVRPVRWFQVHDWLRNPDVRSAVMCFLSGEFRAFLGASKMILNRVGWELGPGLEHFIHFMSMLDAALIQAGFTRNRKPFRPTLSYCGCFVADRAFWCGLTFARPLKFTFQTWSFRVTKKEVLAEGPSEPTVVAGQENDAFELGLEDEKVAFFALSKERQLKVLTDFIKAAHATFLKAGVPEAKAKGGERDEDEKADDATSGGA